MKETDVKFHFIKAPDCKEFSPNGMFGGICPNGNISVALYSERPPIPKEIVHTLEGLKLGPELIDKRIAKTDYVRIVQAVIQIDVVVAKSFVKWLQDRIKDAETAGGQ